MHPQFLCPQYHDIALPAVEKSGLAKANLGLVFDRYLRIWDENYGKTRDIFTPLDVFAKLFGKIDPECLPGIHANLHARQKRILSHMGADAAADLDLETAWRLVCGLGYDHPIENGFTMDYQNGIPYIPASTVKGLCRQAAESAVDQDSFGKTGKETWFPTDFYNLFGSFVRDGDDPDQGRQRGDMIFLDAFPAKLPVAVAVDVINVHNKSYYKSDLYQTDKKAPEGKQPLPFGQGAPMATENPVPVFFLTIAPGTRFVFRFFSRSNNMDHVHKIRAALLEGLSFFGIGAKTAAGYGRFKPGASKGGTWIDTVIQQLCEKHNEPRTENILRGKALCGEWQKIDDPELKQEVREQIGRLWEKRGISPTKKVLNMYHQR